MTGAKEWGDRQWQMAERDTTMTAMMICRTTITAIIPAKWGNTKQQSTKKSSYPRENHIIVLGGLSSITPTHRHGTKGLMWGARGPFLPVMAMGVMLVVGSWSLGHVSTVRIVYLLRNLVGRHWTYWMHLSFVAPLVARTGVCSSTHLLVFSVCINVLWVNPRWLGRSRSLAVSHQSIPGPCESLVIFANTIVFFT